MVIHRKPHKRGKEEGWLLSPSLLTRLLISVTLKPSPLSFFFIIFSPSPNHHSSAWSLPLFFLTPPHLLTPGSLALSSKAKIFAEKRQRRSNVQRAPHSIHNGISWKSRAGESMRRERANMRRGKEKKKVGEERQHHCRALRGCTNSISYLNTAEGGIYLLTDPWRSEQHKLYHFDIKQGEAGEEEKKKCGGRPRH